MTAELMRAVLELIMIYYFLSFVAHLNSLFFRTQRRRVFFLVQGLGFKVQGSKQAHNLSLSPFVSFHPLILSLFKYTTNSDRGIETVFIISIY